MTQDTVGKIYPRSPRYVLQMKDKKILRYASYPRGQRAFFTEIVNISETGMAFTVPFLDAPHKNEIIMIEFTPPGDSKSVACYAQVKRIQKISIIEADLFQKNCKLVAVMFTSLPDEQRAQIRAVLTQKFQKLNHSFRWQQTKMRFLWMFKFKRKQIYMLFGSFFLGTIGLYSALYYFIF